MTRFEPFAVQDLGALPALQPAGWSDLAPIFRFYVASQFCFPVKVTSDSTTMGIGCAIRFEDSAWLAHIIVRPGCRRNGVGTMIVEHLVAQLTDPHVRSVSLIASDEGYPLYLRFGFAQDREYEFYEIKEALTGGDHPRMIEGAAASDFNDILDLDGLVSGEQREPLLRPHLPNALVARNAGSISGVYFPTLGEGSIEAINVDAGIGLLSHRLLKHNKCVLQADNEDAIEFLKENGHKEFRRAWRTTRGVRPAWHSKWVFSRIAGNLG